MFWPPLISAILRIFGVAEWLSGVPGQSALLALASFTVAGLLVLTAARLCAARREHRASLSRVQTTLRERSLRTAFLPQRDPDAAGRPRPEPPGWRSRPPERGQTSPISSHPRKGSCS